MRVIAATCLTLIAAALAACSGNGFGVSLPAIPALPSNAPEFPGSSTTVFTRIARGANSCWFGPRGALDRTYIWHARADPEAVGGMAEILVHERVEQNYRGSKAFHITIGPKGDGAAVAVSNLKMPEATSQRMTVDAYRWARGGVGCTEGDATWVPLSPEAVASAPDPKKKKTPVRKTTAPGGKNASAPVAIKDNEKPSAATPAKMP